MNLDKLITHDLEVLTNIIKTNAYCFVSPHISLVESYAYLNDFNRNLTYYFELREDGFLSYGNKYGSVYLDLPKSFQIFLYFAYLKKDSSALTTFKLIQDIDNFSIFKIKDFSYNGNPYYELFNNLYKSSSQLLSGEITHNQFMGLLDHEKDFLFPDPIPIEEDIDFVKNSTKRSFDFQLLADDCIIYLKEKIYLNLLLHFIDKPEEYNESSYFFLDFLGSYSFNKGDDFSFSHLKPFFMRFEQKHWNAIKKFKKHYAYQLFLEAVFIDYENYNLNNDICYFDFESFILLIKKNLILDDLFQCEATNNKSMKDYCDSILEKNNYFPDNKRFNHLMIIYEKNKMEMKLKSKNIHAPLQKI